MTSAPVEDAPALRDAPRMHPAAASAEALASGAERGKIPAAALRVDEHLVCLRSPDSFEADQYRVLRHYLQAEGHGLQVVAVSSPAAGEGKTTTAINLAATLAQSRGMRVLLVDTDLRRPCVAASLGLQPAGPGLAGALMDERLDLPSVVHTTPFKLSVIPAGAAPVNAYQLLESPRMARLLQAARASYDHVILDTPPLLLVPDYRLLSQSVDGLLIVVAAQRTPRKLLAETLSATDPAKLVGIVFNGDDRPLAGHYKGYYAGYYGERNGRGQSGGWRSWWRRRPPTGQTPWR